MRDSLTTKVYLGPSGGNDLELEASKSETTPQFLVGVLVRDGLKRLRSGQIRIVNPAHEDGESSATALSTPPPGKQDRKVFTFKIPLSSEQREEFEREAAKRGISTDELLKRIAIKAMAEPSSGGQCLNHQKEAVVPALDISGMLTGAEALQLDALALRNGVAPEALAAGAVQQLLKHERRTHKKFRLRLPKTLKKRLEKEAEALGCGAGELVALLLSWDAGRPQATVAGG